jgi:hypothetical protein
VARSFVVVILAAVAAWAAPPASQKITGVITDSMCADGDHSHMKMGPTDAECTKACITYHGAMYVLYDGKQTYTLSDQKTPENFAGKRVTVTGALNAATKTIQVDSIAAAK